MWGRVAFGCIVFLILVFLLIVGIIFLIRTVPNKALSTTCDDSNACTHDFLETVRGVTEGCCSHCPRPNEAECTSACYDDPMCMDGACVGTCKGHCVDMNAFDCPKIKAANLSAVLNFAGEGADTTATFYTLYRECALNTCVYTIDMDFGNVTYNRTGFIPAVWQTYFGDGTNTTANVTAGLAITAGYPADSFFHDMICLPLINADDRECLTAINLDWGAESDGTFTALCKYVYSCSEPPSYAGEVEFPVRKKFS